MRDDEDHGEESTLYTINIVFNVDYYSLILDTYTLLFICIVSSWYMRCTVHSAHT